MKVFGTVPEEEMVSEFLKAEVDSPSYRQFILPSLKNGGKDRSIIDSPNLLDITENDYRAELLGYRGYKKNLFLFAGFPSNMQWQSASMTREDLMKAKYLKCPPWIELSGGSRIVGDAVHRLREGKVTNAEVSRVKDLFEAGISFPRVIVVGNSIQGELIILEGHKRITGFLMAGLETEMTGIVGTSKDISNWVFY